MKDFEGLTEGGETLRDRKGLHEIVTRWADYMQIGPTGVESAGTLGVRKQVLESNVIF